MIKTGLLKLSVIIVNYNVKYFLEQCVCSVLKAIENIDAEIFVVDNHSTDQSKSYLENRFPPVQFRWLPENLGFGKANNFALKEARGEFVLFLNPDTIVAEDCFTNCLEFFKQYERCAALGVHMIDGAGKYLPESKRSFPSVSTSFFKMSGLTALFPKSAMFAKYYAGHLDEKSNHEVDVLAGAFMMIKNSVLQSLKGFDENFFMYGEDIDLSYRIQQAGWKNYYFSGTSIIHFKGESTQKKETSYVYRFYNAMQLFVSKHYKEKKMLSISMKMAINAGRLLALTKVSLKKYFSKKQTETQIATAICAGQQSFDQLLHLIRYAQNPLTIKGRVAISKNDKGAYIGTMENIEQVIIKQQLQQLVFTETSLSFKDIIRYSKQLSGKVNFLYHAANSQSIVGSNRKSENGFFIVDH